MARGRRGGDRAAARVDEPRPAAAPGLSGPPPPVTLTGGAADLLGDEARAPLPGRLRALLAAVVVVLGCGVAVAYDLETAPPAAPVPLTAGVGATAEVELERRLAVQLDLDVTVAGGATGRGDTGGPAQPQQLRLVDVTARGFQVRLVGRSAPLVLGDLGRFGSGLQYVVPLGAEVVVVDCSVDVGAQRRLTLLVRTGDGPVSRVPVQAEPAVVRALDDLVRRTCRRPRG